MTPATIKERAPTRYGVLGHSAGGEQHPYLGLHLWEAGDLGRGFVFYEQPTRCMRPVGPISGIYCAGARNERPGMTTI